VDNYEARRWTRAFYDAANIGAVVTMSELGNAATGLDPIEKAYRLPFRGAGGLNLPSLPLRSGNGVQRRAVLYAYGARFPSAVTIPTAPTVYRGATTWPPPEGCLFETSEMKPC
jgi:hypothetical protein